LVYSTPNINGAAGSCLCSSGEIAKTFGFGIGVNISKSTNIQSIQNEHSIRVSGAAT